MLLSSALLAAASAILQVAISWAATALNSRARFLALVEGMGPIFSSGEAPCFTAQTRQEFSPDTLVLGFEFFD